ncbi:MAG: hypothetical protein AAGA68_21285 [Pseudomonadota bacterium]
MSESLDRTAARADTAIVMSAPALLVSIGALFVARYEASVQRAEV